MKTILLFLLTLALAACQTAPTEIVMTSTPEPTLTPIPPSPTPSPEPQVGFQPYILEKIEDFSSTSLGNNRSIWVYLPGNYADSPEQRYPVLYANDGQDMPAVGMEKTLNNLAESGDIEPVIVVAIHATGERLQEYGTASSATAEGYGKQASSYTDFVINEVMPYIDKNYRTLNGPENTAIIGWSLGGLSAFDIAWNHADRFGTVGAFSGSFWWRTDASSLEARMSSRIAHQMVLQGNPPLNLRLWFEAGTHDETDDRDGNGVIDAIQDTTELIDALVLTGYQREVNVIYVQVEGGQHNQATWGKVLPEFLIFAFPTR